VHERDPRSSGFDGGAVTGHGRQRFAAERSTEMTQEDQQQRMLLLHRIERRGETYAVVTAVCAHCSSLRASS
jgi:hypothetical protein